MITILLKNPKLFSYLDTKLTNEEIKLILKEKNYKFLVDSIPLRLFDLEKLDIEIFYKLLKQPNFIRFIANFIETNLEIDVIETLNNRIKNINDISLIEFFFTYATYINILNYFTKEFIETNYSLIKFINDINPYIDVIIKEKISLNRKSIESLKEENLFKLMESNIYNNVQPLLNWVYYKLIKFNQSNKIKVIDHMIDNKSFSGDYGVIYLFTIDELNKLFNSNPTESNYYHIINVHNKNDFKFNNVKILEYDLNTIIDLDKEVIFDNYDYIKNLILSKGCGKSNLKRFLKINKDKLTEDIISYATNKVPLFVTVLLDLELSIIREKKEKQKILLTIKDLETLMKINRKLNTQEMTFINDNFDLTLPFINNWEYLNGYSINLIKQKIKELRD